MLKNYKSKSLLLLLIIVLNLGLVACSDKPAPLPTDLPPTPPETTKGDWTMASYNAYLHGQNPDFTAITPENVAQTALQWQFNGTAPLAIAPAIATDTVYLNNGQGKLFALDKAKGTIRWTFDYKGSSQSAPVVAEGKVFLVTTNGQITALKTADGKLIWQKEFNQPTLSDPIYQDKALYFNFLPLDPTKPLSNTLAAISTTDGATLWQTEVRPAATVSRNKAIMTATPPVINQTFYMVNGISPASVGTLPIGKNRPNNQESNGPLNAALLYRQGRMYAVLSGGEVAAFNLDKALTTPLWFINGADDSNKENPVAPALAEDSLIVVDNKFDGSGRVRSLSLENGKANWEWTSTQMILAPPTVSNSGLVFIATAGGILQLLNAKDGKPLWSYQIEGAIRARPVLAGDSFYFAAKNGQLYKFGIDTNNVTILPETRLAYLQDDSNGFPQIFSGKGSGATNQLTQNKFALPPDWASLPGTYVEPKNQLNYAAVVSPDGYKVAFASRSAAAIEVKTSLFVADIDNPATPVPLDDANSYPINLTWSRDGKTLYWVGEKSNLLYRLRLETNRAERVGLTLFADWRPRYPQVSPDEQFLYFTVFDGGKGSFPEAKAARIFRLNLANNAYEVLAQEPLALNSLSLSPDGKWLTYVRELPGAKGNGEVIIIPAGGGTPRKVAEGRAPALFAPYQNSNWLFFQPKDAVTLTNYQALSLDQNMNVRKGSNPPNLNIVSTEISWAVRASQPALDSKVIPTYNPKPFYLPDKVEAEQAQPGKYAFVANGKLYLSTGNGAAVAELPAVNGRISQPVLSPNGGKIAFVVDITGQNNLDGDSQLWVMEVDGKNPRLISGMGRNLFPAWASDNNRLAFSSNRVGEKFQIWLAETDKDPIESSLKQVTNQPEDSLQPVWFGSDNFIIYVTAKTATPDATFKFIGDNLNILNLQNGRSSLLTRFNVRDNKVFLDAVPAGAGSQVVAEDANSPGVIVGVLNPHIVEGTKLLVFNVITTLPGIGGKPVSEIRTAFLESKPANFELVVGWGECNGYRPVWTGRNQQAISCIAAKVPPAEYSRLLYALDAGFPGDVVRGSSRITKPNVLLVLVQSAFRFPITYISWSL